MILCNKSWICFWVDWKWKYSPWTRQTIDGTQSGAENRKSATTPPRISLPPKSELWNDQPLIFFRMSHKCTCHSGNVPWKPGAGFQYSLCCLPAENHPRLRCENLRGSLLGATLDRNRDRESCNAVRGGFVSCLRVLRANNRWSVRDLDVKRRFILVRVRVKLDVCVPCGIL